jgi:hypothetical protein
MRQVSEQGLSAENQRIQDRDPMAPPEKLACEQRSDIPCSTSYQDPPYALSIHDTSRCKQLNLSALGNVRSIAGQIYRGNTNTRLRKVDHVRLDATSDFKDALPSPFFEFGIPRDIRIDRTLASFDLIRVSSRS